MDCTTCYCRMPQCPLFGQVAPRAQFTWHDWHRQAPRWHCRSCRILVSARTGTAYAGMRTEMSTYLHGAVALAEGVSIRATGRLLGVDKDTVNHWLPILGRHCQGVMNYFFRNLHLSECQLDELWTFIAKKQAHLTPLEQLQEVYGDAWVWIAFSPSLQVGPGLGRGQAHFASCAPAGVSAEIGHRWPHPVLHQRRLAALRARPVGRLRAVGHTATPRNRGRLPKPRRFPPPDLCYAVVVKERANGRVVDVTTRIVYGTTEQVKAALRASPVSRTINTYGVERNNLTIRQHSRRMGRKVNAFSKDPDYLEQQLTLAFAYYHFVVPHRSLRQRLPHPLPTKGRKGSRKKWRPVTPAMAAGLTDHVWTMDELLSFRVPPDSLW